MDGSRRRFLSSLVALAGAAAASAAPVPPPKKRPAPKRWAFEIDLALLPEHVEFDLAVRLRAGPDRNMGLTTRVKRGTTRAALRDHVLDFLKDTGWRVRKSGATALIVEGSERGGFLPVSRVEALSEALPWNRQPAVRRVVVK